MMDCAHLYGMSTLEVSYPGLKNLRQSIDAKLQEISATVLNVQLRSSFMHQPENSPPSLHQNAIMSQ